MSSKTKSTEEKKNWTPYYAGAVLFVCLIYFGSWMYIWHTDLTNNERGQFGDMFGAVNALFSGLAFAGIIVSMYKQSYEIQLQRRDVKENILASQQQGKALLLQQQEMKETRAELQMQRFESSFFKLIEVLNDTIRNHPFLERKLAQQHFEVVKEMLFDPSPAFNSLEELDNLGHKVYGYISASGVEVKFHTVSILTLIQESTIDKSNKDNFVQIMYNMLPDVHRISIVLWVLEGEYRHVFNTMDIGHRLDGYANSKYTSPEVSTQLQKLLKDYRVKVAEEL